MYCSKDLRQRWIGPPPPIGESLPITTQVKVLLSVRTPESWWRSINDTLYPVMKNKPPENAPPIMKQQNEMARKQILETTFGGRFEDKAHSLAVYQRHVDEVRAYIDPKRLLVFDVAESWAPLCRFLGVAEPTDPFPRLNDTATFQAMIKGMMAPST